MKKILNIAILALSLFLSQPADTKAQNPPHPNGGGGPGSGNTPVGGGAPLDGGMLILALLGAAYGGKRVYKTVNFNHVEQIKL